MHQYPADTYTEPEPDADTLAFRTDRYTIRVDIHADGTWSYEQDTLLIIPGQSEPFNHTDRNRLFKIAEPTPNPTAQASRLTTLCAKC